MVCLSCHEWGPGRLCLRCRSSIRPAPEHILAGGVAVLAAFEHEGATKALIHHLKYRGVSAVAELAAEVLVHRLPPVPIVPIPRALSRRLKYGVDPAREIANALARRLRVPVVSALVPPVHTPRRAGRDHSRSVPPFRLRRKPMTPVTLVDDVVTTGATVRAAVGALGADSVRLVAAASVVPSTSNVVAA